MSRATQLQNAARKAHTPRPPAWHAAAEASAEDTPAPGGWAVVIHNGSKSRTASGGATHTTAVEMALRAALAALGHTPRTATLQITTSLGALHPETRLKACAPDTHAAELERTLRDALATRRVRWRWIATSDEDGPEGASHQAATLARTQADTHRLALTDGPRIELRTPITAAILRRQLEQHPGTTAISSADTAHTITAASLAAWLAIVPGATMLHARAPIVIHTARATPAPTGGDPAD